MANVILLLAALVLQVSPGPSVEHYSFAVYSYTYARQKPVPARRSSLVATMSSAKYVGFLGGANKFGRWIPEQEIKARAVAGGATIDFSQALFVHPVITIRATAFWGGVSLIVPPNVLVQQNGRAILGGFGDGGGVYHSSSGPVAETVSNSGVMIKIVGTAVMGSVSAMVNRKARPAELLTPEEAAAKMQEAAEPSTTRQDIREQHFSRLCRRKPRHSTQRPSHRCRLRPSPSFRASPFPGPRHRQLWHDLSGD
eukprot:s1255_g4.t1